MALKKTYEDKEEYKSPARLAPGYNIFPKGNFEHPLVAKRLIEIAKQDIVYYHNFKQIMDEGSYYITVNTERLDWLARVYGGNDIEDLKEYLKDHYHKYVMPAPELMIEHLQGEVQKYLEHNTGLQSKWINTLSSYFEVMSRVNQRIAGRR